MRFILIVSLFGFLISVACREQKPAQEPAPATESIAEVEESTIYYTCPMEEHKHIHSDSVGTCSECNMVLVAAVVTSEDKMEFYGCPMLEHSHVRSEQPGTCADCGMTLKPMRLVKD